MDSRILDAETIKKLQHKYALEAEFLRVCTSHEALRKRVGVLEPALRTLIEDYYVEETYPATVKAVRAVLAVPEGTTNGRP